MKMKTSNTAKAMVALTGALAVQAAPAGRKMLASKAAVDPTCEPPARFEPASLEYSQIVAGGDFEASGAKKCVVPRCSVFYRTRSLFQFLIYFL